MTTTLKDLRERRGRLVAEMRGLLDAAGAEARDLTAEQQARYDEMFAEQERVGNQIAREERQQDLDRRMAESAARGAAAAAQPGPKPVTPRARSAPGRAPRRSTGPRSPAFCVAVSASWPATNCAPSRLAPMSMAVISSRRSNSSPN